jgi:hypothetical protein|tara:strand:- start:734 stop:940 length:207 start_codon:yes stop_codon:yes gene_type:complete
MKQKKMNRPLMFINNNVIVEQLKDRVWEDYQIIPKCDVQGWLEGLSPVERTAWEVKFDELNNKTIKNG